MNIIKQFDPTLASRNPNARLARKDFFARVNSQNGDWQRIEKIAKDTRMTPTEVMQAISPER